MRLDCLDEVGVGYLTLARSGRSLSGGETQRVRIAAALGNSLTDTLFVLDEPTVGLHAIDTQRMLTVLRRMAETGNTVVVVEHDPAVIDAADHLIVLGPGGGREGGRIIYEGPPARFLSEQPGFFVATGADMATAPVAVGSPPVRRLRGTGRSGPSQAASRLRHPWDESAVLDWLRDHDEGTPAQRRASRMAAGVGRRARRVGGVRDDAAAEDRGGRRARSKIARLAVPLVGLTVLSGVSGSGKSTLLDEVIHRNWLRSRGLPVESVGHVGAIGGWEAISETHFVGQELLGRSSRSNPISFVQAYAGIRELLAGTIAARQRHLAPGAFSFNTVGGRCETCHGMGTQTLEMYFLPDVEVTCEACAGRRFGSEVLEVTWRGKNIAEILELTVDEAFAFFAQESKILMRLEPLRRVGLGYITLGQGTTTLSGGEGQRLKLAAFLADSGEAGRAPLPLR